MKRPELVSRGALMRLLQAAETAWNNRDFQQTIDQLERASRLDPANCQILLQLGRVYGLRYDYASAERAFEKAVRLAPKKTDVLQAAALNAVDFPDHQLAERYFQRALDQTGVSAEILAKLAQFYERLSRVDTASELIERALKLDPACPSALLAQARMERQAGRLENAERLLRSFPSAINRETNVRRCYELGMVLDRQNRFDEAMAAFLEAKALVRSDASPWLEHLQKKRLRLKEMQASVSAEMMQRWQTAGESLQPRRRFTLLCGHPRSGTTLLEQILDSHPEIVSAEETTIFHDEAYVPLRRGFPEGTAQMLAVLESASVEALQRSRERYFHCADRWLGTPVGGKVLIDKNPSLTVLIPSVVRIFPETKLLVALRDPRDVCLSCFMQTFFPVNEISAGYLSLEETMDEYATVMGIWRTLAPLLKNPYLEVRYEDMVEDLEPVAHRVLDFLAVSWTPEVLRFHEHAQKKMVRSPTYADVTQPIFKRAVGRWQKYEKYFESHLDKLAPFLSAFGYES